MTTTELIFLICNFSTNFPYHLKRYLLCFVLLNLGPTSDLLTKKPQGRQVMDVCWEEEIDTSGRGNVLL